MMKKYHIGSSSVMFSWMKRFMNEGDSLPLQQKSQIEEKTAKTKDDSDFNRIFYEIMLHFIQNDYLCQVL